MFAEASTLLFVLPLGAEASAWTSLRGELLFEFRQAFAGGVVGLLLEGFAFDLELHDAAELRRVRSGIESISVRSLAAASSTRSMALSGRKRSEM
jgi:hypothetical protein